MTPLERAKAFIQSRAAKTALKILPLALATAAAVPAANADVVISPTVQAGEVPTGYAATAGAALCQAGCGSGSFVLGAGSTASVGSSAPAFGVTGAFATGNGGAYMAGDPNQPEPWTFFIQGDAGSSGALSTLSSLTIGWDFTFHNDTVPSAPDSNSVPPAPPNPNDMTLGDAQIQWFFQDASGNSVSNTCDIGTLSFGTEYKGSCQASGFSGMTDNLSLWGIDLVVPSSSASQHGYYTWDITSFGVAGTQPVVGTPEPATLTLLVAAVPFLLRRRR